MSIRIAKDTRSPSLSDTIRVGGEPFDLTGCTVTFRMRAVGSSTLLIDAEAVVVSAVDGTVRYDWAEGDLDTIGDFAAWWLVTLPSTKTQESSEFIIEVVGHVDAATNLVTLAAVREALEFPESDRSRDRLIESLIPRVTAAIQRECQREFVPTASATRTFQYRRSLGVVDLAPYDLRSVTTLTVHPGETQATTATANSDFYLAPLNDPDAVYRFVKFSPDFSPETSDFETAFGLTKVSIAGAWGFASVPAPVEQAAILTVSSWMARDVAAFGLEDFGGRLDEPRGVLPPSPVQYAIPTPAWRLLSPYMRRTIV